MKWLFIGLGILAGVVAVAAVSGWMLPVAHTARRQQRLAAPPEAVWRALTEVEAFPSWRPDVKRVERLPSSGGRTAWIEEGSDLMTIAVERSEPPRLLVTRIGPGLPFGGTWTYEIAPEGIGSVLTITEDGEVYNPIFRFMSRFIFGHEQTLAAYLSALDAKLSPEAPR
jgi:uncharacterized protein YndB with AHSA1/START domain